MNFTGYPTGYPTECFLLPDQDRISGKANIWHWMPGTTLISNWILEYFHIGFSFNLTSFFKVEIHEHKKSLDNYINDNLHLSSRRWWFYKNQEKMENLMINKYFVKTGGTRALQSPHFFIQITLSPSKVIKILKFSLTFILDATWELYSLLFSRNFVTVDLFRMCTTKNF